MRLSEYAKGLLVGVIVASLVQIPLLTVAQQNTQTGRVWATVWGFPSGGTFLVTSGACPTGTSEVAALSGKMPLGTVAANMDVGGTGGSDTITSVINHSHTVNITDPGHTHLTQRYPTATGGSSGFTIDTSMSGTLADNTLPVKSATTGISATTDNPAGGVASIDNRSAFMKVIWCQKT